MKILSFLILLVICIECIISEKAFGSEFTFIPVWEQVKFSQRKAPAEMTTETEESLKKKGYVRIGDFKKEKELKTYWNTFPDCFKIETPDNFSKDIAAIAASYGGDLIVLGPIGYYSFATTKNGNCLRSERRSRTETYQYKTHTGDPGVMATRNVYYSECVEWETINGETCVCYQDGQVWRKQDAELTNLLKRDEMIDIYIKAGGDNSSELKPKSESEFKAFIAKFEEMDKYYAMKKWYDYNVHLMGKDTKAEELKSYSDFDEKFRKRFGYKDNTGKTIIEPQFISANDFADNVGCVSITEGLKQSYGYIDKTAHWVISPSFDEADDFQSGVAHVKINGKQGYIDKTGKLYMADEIREPVQATANQLKTEGNQKSYNIALIEDDAEFFKAIAILDEDQKYIAVKTRQDDILSLSSDILRKMYWDTTLIVSVFIKDNTGKLVIKPESIECRKVKCFWGFTDMKGNIVVEPKFDYCLGFSDGLAAVGLKKNKLKLNWGYIDKSGNWIIPPVYDDASLFFGGIARVRINGKEKYIDKIGTLYGK